MRTTKEVDLGEGKAILVLDDVVNDGDLIVSFEDDKLINKHLSYKKWAYCRNYKFLWVYSKKITKKHTLWSLDKLVIAVALAAGFIRVGNLMNSEIVGIQTNSETSLFYEYKAKGQISVFFNIDKEKIQFVETKKDTLIDGVFYPKKLVSVPLGLKKMNPYFAEAFSDAFSFIPEAPPLVPPCPASIAIVI